MMPLLIWMFSGVLAGWIVGVVMRGRGYGLVGDLVLGLLGGISGGWLVGFIGANPLGDGWLRHILVSVAGGMILVGLSRLIRKPL